MNMDQKGFANIILIILVVVLASSVGYFVLTRKQEPIVQQTVTPPPAAVQTPTPQTPTTSNKPPPSAKGEGYTDGISLLEGTTATIDKKSLVSSSGNVTISGTASGVDVIGVSATDINGYTTFTNVGPLLVVNGRWSIVVSDNIPTTAPSQPLTDGAYHVIVFGPNDIALARGILKIGTITSDPSKPPQLVFILQPSAVPTGQSTTIYWRAPNTTSCEASGDWTGHKFILGDESTDKINASKSYTLTCEGAGGSISKTIQSTPY